MRKQDIFTWWSPRCATFSTKRRKCVDFIRKDEIATSVNTNPYEKLLYLSKLIEKKIHCLSNPCVAEEQRQKRNAFPIFWKDEAQRSFSAAGGWICLEETSYGQTDTSFDKSNFDDFWRFLALKTRFHMHFLRSKILTIFRRFYHCKS